MQPYYGCMGPPLAVSWLCRDCFISDNPCLVCEGLTAEQRARSIQARALRLRRQARHAGSAGSVSGSSQCGPVEGKAFGPLGSTPEPSVKGQGGWVLPPRDLWCRGMVVEAALLPRRCRLLRRTMATPDAIPPWDLGLRMVVVAAFGPPTLPFGERRRLWAARRFGGAPVLRYGCATAPSRRWTRTPMRPSSRPELPGPDQDRTRTGPGPDQTGPGPEQTGPGPDRTGPGPDQDRTGPGMDRTGPGMDRTGSSWFPGPGKDLSERRDASKVDRRSRARKRGQRDASLSSSSSSVSEYRRESRRDRHRRRHGRSRRRYRSVTPPQAATLATEQILRAIADVKRATDAVVARVDSLERGGAMSAGASPLPSVAEQDISLVPAQDDFLSSDEEGSREWRPRHGGGETPSEVVAVAREGVTTASRSTPLEAESIDCDPPPLGMPTLTAIGIRSRQCLPIIPTSHPNHFPWMMCLEGSWWPCARRRNGRSVILPFPVPGCSRALCGLLGGVMEGVSHSPLVEAGRARESAQRWGTYMSLTSPPIRQFKAEYYRIHYPAEVPEAEVLQPQQLWTTSSFLAIAKGALPLTSGFGILC